MKPYKEAKVSITVGTLLTLWAFTDGTIKKDPDCYCNEQGHPPGECMNCARSKALEEVREIMRVATDERNKEKGIA